MDKRKTIFSQLMEFVPKYEFDKCVKKYNGHYKVKRFTCWEQFLCMTFAQLTFRESLRDIEACLRSKQNKLYHVGIRNKISRNTLSNANQQRDWRIYRDFGQQLIKRAQKLYCDEDFCIKLDNAVYALDSTSIALCVSLFPWAAYCEKQAAVKMHTLLNLKGNIPSVIVITDQRTSDFSLLDQIPTESGAIYILDRGYFCLKRLYRIHQDRAFFVTRSKVGFKFKKVKSIKVHGKTNVKSDHIIKPNARHGSINFPETMRLIEYYDSTTDKILFFLTNNFRFKPDIIAQLYRSRWQIELFFKWIKQHLCIKSFFGITQNAVKTQIWIAVSAYVLIAIVKKELNLKLNLYRILQILSVSIFEKSSLVETFDINSINAKKQDFELPLFKI